MNNVIITGIVVAIIAGGGGYWIGTKHTSTQTPFTRGQFAGQGEGRAAGRFGGNGGVFGSIIAKDASSITVQLMGGPNATSTGQTGTGSKIVFFDTTTQIGKMVSGSASDLSVGVNIMVGGTPNSDGSITAQSIQIRPAADARLVPARSQ